MSLFQTRHPIAAALALAALVASSSAAAPWPAPSYLEPLAQVGLRGGHVGWNGLTVGMTLREVEREVGEPPAPAVESELLCPHHRADVVVDGQELGLEFSGTGDEAVLLAIVIPLVPRIGERFETRAVVGALRDRLDLAFVPSPHDPRMTEDQAEKPLYRTRSNELVFVNPESGVAIGAVCVD